MTKKQKQKIIASIKKDAQLAGQYYNRNLPGQYCVIGGLLAHAGYSPEKLFGEERSNQSNITSEAFTGLAKAREILEKVYGLTPNVARQLQSVNDMVGVVFREEWKDSVSVAARMAADTRERRESLLDVVGKFIVTEPKRSGAQKKVARRKGKR
jgi:hypothetical protein